MFSLQTIFGKNKNMVVAERDGAQINFYISAVIAKTPDAQNDEHQFTIVNGYLNYKGDGFKSMLFSKLQEIADRVETFTGADINQVLQSQFIVTDILQLFDLNDMIYYIRDVYKFVPISRLADIYDESIERNSKGTRAQTYLKSDYIELMAFSSILKIAVLPLYNLAYNKQHELSIAKKDFINYILYNFFRSHPIMFTSGPEKLKDMITVLKDQAGKDDKKKDINAVSVLEKGIPKEDIVDFILAIVIFQILVVSSFVTDTNEDNVINNIHTKIKTKLAPNNQTSGTIRSKSPSKTDEGDGLEGESYCETFRIITSLSEGDKIEMNFATESIERIYNQLPDKQKKYVNLAEAKEVRSYISQIDPTNIIKSQITILGSIFKGIIDPRCLYYVEVNNLFNLLAVAYSYLLNLGFGKLALLMASGVNTKENNSEFMFINIGSTRLRLTAELKEELDILYPYKRIINKTVSENIVESKISELVEELMSNRYIFLLPEETIVNILGSNNQQLLLSEDLKILLAQFIITNERMVY